MESFEYTVLLRNIRTGEKLSYKSGIVFAETKEQATKEVQKVYNKEVGYEVRSVKQRAVFELKCYIIES